MNNQLLTDRDGVNLLILFMFGSTLVMGTGGTAKNDTWIATILGMVISIPVLLLYSRILSSYPGKDLYDILFIVFGKPLGKIISVFFVWFSFHLGALVLRNFGEFINTVALPETPKIVPMIMFAGLCAFAAKVKISALAICARYFAVIAITLVLLFAFFTIPEMDPENLRPVLGNGLVPVFKGAFSAFTFPFGETVVFISILSFLKTKKSPYRVYLVGLVIAGFFISFIGLRNVMVLGTDTLGKVYFPSYSAISRINIGDFLQRMEISVSMVFILSGFIKISICLICACKGISKILDYDDYTFIAIPVALLMVNLAYIIYGNTMEMFEWAFDVWPYYAFPFQVFLPVMTFIVSEVRLKRKEC